MGGARRKSVLPGKHEMQMAGDKMGEIAETRSRALQKTAAVYEKRRKKCGKTMVEEAKALGKIESQLVDFERQYALLNERLDERATRRQRLLYDLEMAETRLLKVIERSHEEFNIVRHKVTAFQSRRAIEANHANRGYSMGSTRGMSKHHHADGVDAGHVPKAHAQSRPPTAPAKSAFRPRSAKRPGTANRIISSAKAGAQPARPNTSGGRVLQGP